MKDIRLQRAIIIQSLKIKKICNGINMMMMLSKFWVLIYLNLKKLLKMRTYCSTKNII